MASGSRHLDLGGVELLVTTLLRVTVASMLGRALRLFKCKTCLLSNLRLVDVKIRLLMKTCWLIKTFKTWLLVKSYLLIESCRLRSSCLLIRTRLLIVVTKWRRR